MAIVANPNLATPLESQRSPKALHTKNRACLLHQTNPSGSLSSQQPEATVRIPYANPRHWSGTIRSQSRPSHPLRFLSNPSSPRRSSTVFSAESENEPQSEKTPSKPISEHDKGCDTASNLPRKLKPAAGTPQARSRQKPQEKVVESSKTAPNDSQPINTKPPSPPKTKAQKKAPPLQQRTLLELLSRGENEVYTPLQRHHV